MKFLDLFAGIGGFRSGLEANGHKCVGYVEWDKYARLSYENMYDTKYEWTAHDITKVTDEELESIGQVDIICGGFPCQAFSVAGKRLGFEDTRGTLFFEALRFAKKLNPKIIFMENVKGLVNHNKGDTLSVMVHALNDLGYIVDFDVLNSKYFDVPQNRERIFIIAVRYDLIESEEWNIEGNTMLPKFKNRMKQEGALTFNFNWNKNNVVSKKLKDILESNVDEKFYLDEEKTRKLVSKLNSDKNSIAIKEATKKGYALAKEGDAVNLQFPDSKTRRGRVGDQIAQTLEASNINQGVVEKSDLIMLGKLDMKGNDSIKRVYSIEGQSPCLTTMGGGHREPKIAESNYAIRKLTPLECFRLQGFTDDQFYKAAEVCSNSQLYKQAGNSVTVNVIKDIASKFDELVGNK